MNPAVVGTGTAYRESVRALSTADGYDSYGDVYLDCCDPYPDHIEPPKVKDRIKDPPQYMRRRWQ